MGKKRRGAREPARVEKRVGAPIPAHLRPRPALDYECDAKPDHPFRSVLRDLTPGLNYLTRSYQRRWLRRDGIAGVAVAAYLVPQVMAYAAIIGVPPVASLWTALAAIIAYAVLGSSRVLSAGPESTVALMTAVAIARWPRTTLTAPSRQVPPSRSSLRAGPCSPGCCGRGSSPSYCQPRCSQATWQVAPY